MKGSSKDECGLKQVPEVVTCISDRFLYSLTTMHPGLEIHHELSVQCQCLDCYSCLVTATWSARKFGILPLKYSVQLSISATVVANRESHVRYASAVSTPWGRTRDPTAKLLGRREVGQSWLLVWCQRLKPILDLGNFFFAQIQLRVDRGCRNSPILTIVT